MALARLESGLYHPHPVQLVTGQVGVDVQRGEDVGVAHLIAMQLVGVVGHDHLLAPDQGPVVAVRRAVEHIQLVVGAQAVGGGARIVVGDIGRPSHAALAGVVEPGLARLLYLVEGIHHQQQATGQAGRGQHLLLEQGDAVVEFLSGHTRRVVEEQHVLDELDQGIFAATGRCGLGDGATYLLAAPVQQVIPDHLQPGLG